MTDMTDRNVKNRIGILPILQFLSYFYPSYLSSVTVFLVSTINVVQYYKPDKYTVIQLEYNQIRISSNTVDGSFIGRIGELDWELTSELIGIL